MIDYHGKNGYIRPKRGVTEGKGEPRNVVFRMLFCQEVQSMLSRLSMPDGDSPIENCITCDNFDEKTEVCKLVNVRPPARVIAFGCDKYNGDIPF